MTPGIVKDLDKGFYTEARNLGKTPLAYLAEKVNPEPPEVETTFKRLQKRYRQEDDGSARAMHLREFAYDVTGLEKELAARGKKIRGRGCETVEKTFFSSANDAALFPVFLASQIIAGRLATSLVEFFIAADEMSTSHVKEKITSSDTTATRTLRWTGEGADLPKTKILRAEGEIRLYKYGRLLEVSYEAVRLMTVNMLSLHLARMGRQIGIDESDDLIETLIAGDGTSGSAVTDVDAEVSGTLDYDEIVRLVTAFALGYMPNQAVVNSTNLRTILNMAEFKDPLAGFNFQRSGQFMDAVGCQWHRWDSTGSTSFSTDRILMVDNSGAAVRYQEGDLLEESDQIIEKQLHQRSMSYWAGFMKWDNDCTECLDITT